MKNIWMLTLANLRKSKGQSASLLIFMLIAAMLLNLGLAIFFGVGSLFDRRAEENHAAHYSAVYSDGAEAIAQGLEFMEGHAGVTEIETAGLVGGLGNYYTGDAESVCILYFSAVNATQRMDAPSLAGKSLPLTGDAIYIPYFIYLSGGYEIGDEYKLILSGAELKFTIAGATEEIMYGAQMNTVFRFYVPQDRYDALKIQFPENGLTMLSARLGSSSEDVFFQADYNKAVSTEGLIMDMIYASAKQSRTTIPLIAAVIMTAFAVILLLVSLVVIRFRINNSIEESMTNIGAQKAIGFKSSQIIAAIVLQFTGIALLGTLLGITLAQVAIAPIITMLQPIIAVMIALEVDAVSILISLFFVLLMVAGITLLSAQKISKLHPLIALRGGLTTHSFKHNPLPLDKAKGPLNFLLATKQLLQSKKQAVMILVIVAAVTMASVAGLAVNYNMNAGRDNFTKAFFGEIPDTNFILKSGEDGAAFKARLLEHPKVRKVFGYETSATLLADETGISATVVEDCALLESSMLVDGRYPKHDNEIALGAAILKVSGKGIGDTIQIKSGDIEKEYLITGLVQFMNQNGLNGIITGEGMRRVKPEYTFLGFNAYLNEGTDPAVFIADVKATEDDIFDTVLNAEETLGAIMDSMGGIFGAVAMGIVAVTAFVVILVLYMVIKTMILRKKRELGIQKALGFTTLQLMNQIALNITPVIFLGVLIGAVAGFLGFNPMMGSIMSSMGIVRIQLPAPLGQTLLICMVLVALAYAVAMLVSWRIRKINPYTLVSE